MAPSIAPVALDAMGGDHAPVATVQGAIDAARKGQAIILVGPEERVRAELDRQRASWNLPVQVRHAPEIVGMDDHPGQAMRRKKQNSIRVALEMVRDGEASAAVSAGNSGAVMAGAMMVLGCAGDVMRPAILSVLPAAKGRSVMLDAGANVDCKPIHLVQFALMGEVYSRRVLGVSRPRVALLANGEEASKGTALTRAAAAALARSGLRFQGYCEGRDLLGGDVDVVVTDGFTGNVALKTMEGTAQALAVMMKEALHRTLPARLGGALVKNAIDEIRRRVDWREIGGAPLLGVDGVAVIAHGASDRRAVANAVARAADGARASCTE
ncbi:MAG: fatty acid/phospholipid synthesis protein PlsX, partial [Anaeromyxobacteraceae bacterium]|nr:fatty acid/phospholipid synthesis protein PlsX [Anaeromyxobacteraceae bacterium]